MQSRLVTAPLFRIRRTTARRPSRSRHQCAYSPGLEALLVTAETPGRVVKGTGDLDLTRVFRFPQRDHRIRLGSPIFDVVVREHDAMNRDHSFCSLVSERHSIVDMDRAAWIRRKTTRAFSVLRPWLAIMPDPSTAKSGQVLVRTMSQKSANFPTVIGV